MDMKYVIFNEETMIIFPAGIEHGKMRELFLGEITSAGEISITSTRVSCHGRSVSLDLNSDRDHDTKLAKRLLGHR